jgi:hypothetical protein
LEIKNHVDVEKNIEFQHITSDNLRVTFLEKNGLTVFQKLTFLAPPVQRSRK